VRRLLGQRAPKWANVFWFFFSKKNILSYSVFAIGKSAPALITHGRVLRTILSVVMSAPAPVNRIATAPSRAATA